MNPWCDLAALSGVCPEKLANDLVPTSVTFQRENVGEHAKMCVCVCACVDERKRRKRGQIEVQGKRGKNRGREKQKRQQTEQTGRQEIE